MKPEELLYTQDPRVGRTSRPTQRAQKIATVGIIGLRPGGADRPGLHRPAAVGPQVKAGESFGEVESVKAVSDLYSPVDGEVVEVNAAIADNLEQLAAGPLRRRLAGEDQASATTPGWQSLLDVRPTSVRPGSSATQG